jgi:hypothetical protein
MLADQQRPMYESDDGPGSFISKARTRNTLLPLNQTLPYWKKGAGDQLSFSGQKSCALYLLLETSGEDRGVQ